MRRPVSGAADAAATSSEMRRTSAGGVPPWADYACDWKAIARIERADPPTWGMADELVGAGRRGLLYPSARRPGGVNLVLFCANLCSEDRLESYDPNCYLPRDQRSWEKQ